ncbi:MAG: PD-(D/E)XK nuclease family protein [Dehalococcoidia bacterium]|nr:PD-(D/E)XK nuclease family protein [Dehalococcoidia bacterium]
MPVYSHSQLSTYEQCPLKYKLSYRDRIKRESESVEAFLGNMVHDTLRKCYDDICFTRLNTLDQLLSCYENFWEQRWHDGVAIARADLTRDHFRTLGRRMIETYYRRYAPFDSDVTLGTEVRLSFSLDGDDRYRFSGYIDRLSCTPDGCHRIHDYKTSSHLPSQQEIDSDRQLGLYLIGVRKMWPDVRDIRLIWHYLAFDRELESTRSPEAIEALLEDTARLVDEIEACKSFEPRESALCGWCEFPDLCPMRKHFVTVAELPANDYLGEPGVALVNRFAELKEDSARLDAEIAQVREALINYAVRENVQIIRGSSRKVRVKIEKKLKFPGKNDEGREELDGIVKEAGKWMEVSLLDTSSLVKAVDAGRWERSLLNQVLQYGRLEEASTVSLSRLKEEN